MTDRHPPNPIWLQWGGAEEIGPHIGLGQVTWCRDQIFDHDVKYVRASSVAGPEYVQVRIRQAETARAQAAHSKLKADGLEKEVQRLTEALEVAREGLDQVAGHVAILPRRVIVTAALDRIDEIMGEEKK